MTGIDENRFFRQATLGISSSLNIEVAMGHLMDYLKKHMPVAGMFFGLYDSEAHVGRLLARIWPPDLKPPSDTISLPREYWQRMKEKLALGAGTTLIKDIEAEPDEIVRHMLTRTFPIETSNIILDLELENERLGMFQIFTRGKHRYTEAHAHLISLLHDPLAIAISNILQHQEILRLKDLLADDNRYLQRRMMEMTGDTIIGANFGLQEVMKMVRQVAGLNVPVLLLGETGAGKEVIANTLHHSSERKGHPFIKVNCGAIPENLIDSELFGHEKGAFTGAVARQRGRFERAHMGTIFLDEVGELPAAAQVRLLRVLQNKEIERVGGTETIPIDVRLISATHRNLEEMVAAGQFREDLWFRLNLFPIKIPPLRERTGDIPALVRYFIERKARDLKLRREPALAQGALEGLQSYHWPGNVRELENLVERGLILNQMSEGVAPLRLDLERKGVEDAPVESFRVSTSEPRPLETVMGEYIRKTLDWTQGRVEGPDGAAHLLGLHPSTLRGRMRKLGIPHGRKAGAVRRSG